MRIEKASFLFILFLVFACDNEPFVQVEEQQLRVVKGRVFFENKESLKIFLNEAREEPLDILHEKLSRLQSNGFNSLMPTFKVNDNVRKADYAAKIKSRKTRLGRENAEEIDAMDNPVIADPHFASILNEEAEIHVDDYIYKYTDIGMVYTHTENYSNMESMIDRIDPCQMQATTTDGRLLSDGVYGFVPQPIDCSGGGGCLNCGAHQGVLL